MQEHIFECQVTSTNKFDAQVEAAVVHNLNYFLVKFDLLKPIQHCARESSFRELHLVVLSDLSFHLNFILLRRMNNTTYESRVMQTI